MKRKDYENEENDHQRENALNFNQIFSTDSQKKMYGAQSLKYW